MSDPLVTIRRALNEAKHPCLTCSFQAEDMVVLQMLRQERPDVAVLFLDTVHHFAETYAYRDEMARLWQLRLINLRAETPSPGLWQASTDACCARHKVEPLFTALEQYDVWFTGLRREQSPSRARLQEVELFQLPSGSTLKKVSPLAHWTSAQVFEYARASDASRVRRCHWTLVILGPVVGRDKNSSVAFTCSRPASACGIEERREARKRAESWPIS